MSTQTAQNTELSTSMNETLEGRIDETRRLVRKVDFSLSILTLLSIVFGVLLMAIVADHWLFADGLSTGMRLAVFGGLVFAVAFYIYRRIVPLFLYPINPVYAASILEESAPSLKNSVINWILLRRERLEREGAADKLSERMFDGVTRSAAVGVQEIPSERAVDLRGIAHWGIILTLLFLFFVGYGISSPKSPMTSLARIMLPWSRIRTPQEIQFHNVEPGNAVAQQGEHLTISAELVGRTAGRETVYVIFSTDDGQAVRQAVPMTLSQPRADGQTRYEAAFPPGKQGFVSGVDYWLQQGESRSQKYRIDVRPIASIEIDSLTYKYPDYTGLSEETVETGGDIRGVEGTEVKIAVRSTMPLQRVDLILDNDPAKAVAMRLNGDNAATTTLTLRHNPESPTPTTLSNYSFRAVDTEGYESRRSGIFRMEVLPDRPPVVQWSDTDAELAERLKDVDQLDLPVNGSLELPVQAEDPDFGLRYLRFHVESGNKRIRHVDLIESASMGPTKHIGPIRAKTVFSPATSRLSEGDTAEIWIEASDTKLPEPNTASTRKITVRIGAPQQPPQQPEEQTKKEEDKEEKKDGKEDKEKEKDKDQGDQGTDNDKKKDDDNADNSTDDDAQKPDDDPNAENSNDSGMKDDPKDDGKDDSVDEKGESDKTEKNGAEQEQKTGESESDKDDSSGKSQQDGGKDKEQGDNQGNEQSEGGNSSSKQDKKSSQENQQGSDKQNGEKQQGPEGQQKPEDAKDGAKNGNKKPVDPNTQDGDAMERILEQMKKENKLPGNEKPDSKQDKKQEKDQDSKDPPQEPQGDQQEQQKPEPQKKSCENGDCQQSDCEKCNGGGGQDEKKDGKSGQGEKSDGQGSGQSDSSKEDGGQESSKDSGKDGGQDGGADGTEETDKQGNQSGKTDSDSKDSSEGDAEKGDKPGEGEQQSGGGGGEEKSPGKESGGDSASGGGQGDKNSDPSSQKNDNSGDDGQDMPVDPNDDAPRERDRTLDPNSKDRKSQGGDSSEPKKSGETVKDMPDNTTTSGDTGKGQESRQQGSSEKTQSAEDGDMKGDKGKDGVEQEGGDQGTGKQQEKPGGEQESSGGEGKESEQGAKDDSPSQGGKGKPSEQGGESGSGEPGEMGDPSQSNSASTPGTGGGTGPATAPTPKDEANLEYSEKVTNLVLEYLEDQLKDTPNQELLDELGWTEDELRNFHRKWKDMAEQGRKPGPQVEDANDDAWKEALKSLGLRPSRERQEQRRSHSEFKDAGSSAESLRYAPPKAIQKRWQRYNENIGTGK